MPVQQSRWEMATYILTDTTLYDNLTGLSLDVETGKGMFV